MADLTKLSVKELSEILSNKGFDEDVIQLLQNEKVDGEIFTVMTEQDLKDLSVKFGDRKKLLKLIQQHCNSQQQSLEPPAPDGSQTNSHSPNENSGEIVHQPSTQESEDVSQSQRPDVTAVCSFKNNFHAK